MKPVVDRVTGSGKFVVPYIGTWIETETWSRTANLDSVVPYIGTWIETEVIQRLYVFLPVVPYIGTWIETDTP